MKFEYEGNQNKSGIYSITNVVNGKIYIGSTKKLITRSKQHYRALKSNRRCNRHLQASFNKHGEDKFIFKVLEVTTGTLFDRMKLEERYIQNHIMLGNCYNQQKKTTKNDKRYWSYNPAETKRKIAIATKRMWKNTSYREHMKRVRTGQKRSEETKNKLREQKLGSLNPMFGRNFSKEHRKNMSLSRKGEKSCNFGKKFSQEICDKISASRKGKGLGPCKEETKKKISEKNKGTKPTAFSIERAIETNSKTYNIVLLSPVGEQVLLIKNAAEFCRKYNLKTSSFNKLLNKQFDSYKGWTLYIKNDIID